MKLAATFLIAICLAIHSHGQSTNDSLKIFVQSFIEKTIGRSQAKNIAIHEFTDISGKENVVYRYLTDMVSTHADHDSIQIINREQFQSITDDLKIKMKYPVDDKTLIRIGRSSPIEAVMFGKVIFNKETQQYQILLNVRSTKSGWTISTSEQRFTVDPMLMAFLEDEKIPKKEPFITVGTVSRPTKDPPAKDPPIEEDLPEEEEPEEVDSSYSIPNCEEENTGDFTFKNNSTEELQIGIYNKNSRYNYGMPVANLIIKPGKEKIFNLPAQNYLFVARRNDKEAEVLDEGRIRVERCKVGKYVIE